LPGGDIYRRAIKLTTFASPKGLERMKDVLDQYETVARIPLTILCLIMQGVTVLSCPYCGNDHVCVPLP
jgi:hypothetical protein